MTIELCKEFNCPFRGPDNCGCLYYVSASVCHLNRDESGIRKGVNTVGGSPHSQQWVRVSDGTDLGSLREAQEAFLARPEIQQRLREDQLLDEYDNL